MPEVDVPVQALLERQLDAQPDGHPAGLLGTLVGGLHDPGTATGDHREALLGQRGADLLGLVVVLGARLGPGAAEHGDGPRQAGQRTEALDELGLDPQHPPRVGVHPVAGSAGVEQPLVGGAAGLVALVAAQPHRAPESLRHLAVSGCGSAGLRIQSHRPQ